METIDCPHCNGTGSVPEDFLTTELVKRVFSEWCEIMGIVPEHFIGWKDNGGNVRVVCEDDEDYDIPREVFTRNELIRRRLAAEYKLKEDIERRADLIRSAEDEVRRAQLALEHRRKALARLSGTPT